MKIYHSATTMKNCRFRLTLRKRRERITIIQWYAQNNISLIAVLNEVEVKTRINHEYE